MERKIQLHNTEVKYIYKRLRRAKSMTITVRPNASVMVTTPVAFPVWYMEVTLHRQADWILKKINEFSQTKNHTLAGIGPAEYRQYKEASRKYIEQIIQRLNQTYNFSYNRVSVRNQGTMWGSCSQHGNLNFNFKLYFLPHYLAEYVVAHELCHLQELNHSPRFWQLLAQTIPDYKARVKALKSRY